MAFLRTSPASPSKNQEQIEKSQEEIENNLENVFFCFGEVFEKLLRGFLDLLGRVLETSYIFFGFWDIRAFFEDFWTLLEANKFEAKYQLKHLEPKVSKNYMPPRSSLAISRHHEVGEVPGYIGVRESYEPPEACQTLQDPGQL